MAPRRKRATKKTTNGALSAPPELGSYEYVPMYKGMATTTTEDGKAEIEVPTGVLGDERFAEVEVGIRYLEAGALQRWNYRLLKFRKDEALRMAKTREGLTKEQAPELWEDRFFSEESEEELAGIYCEIFDEAVEDIRGYPGVEGHEASIDILMRLEMGAQIRLADLCKKAQGLERQQVFC